MDYDLRKDKLVSILNDNDVGLNLHHPGARSTSPLEHDFQK